MATQQPPGAPTRIAEDSELQENLQDLASQLTVLNTEVDQQEYPAPPPGEYDDDGYYEGEGEGEGEWDDAPRADDVVEELVVVDPSLLRRTNGYLTKKGGARHNWKRRFFVLQHNLRSASDQYKLLYFGKPSDQQPKGVITLDGAEVVVANPAVSTHKNRNVKWEFEVRVAGGRIFDLYADTAEERDEWVATLRAVVAASKQKIVHKRRYQERDAEAQPLSYIELAQMAEDEAQNCEAFGPGLFGTEAGKTATFTVQANDAMGNPRGGGGLVFSASLENEELYFELPVFDNGDGTYTVEYITSRPSQYQLHVTLEEYEIYGSPFAVTVQPAPTAISQCFVRGDGLKFADIGTSNHFTVVACDVFGTERQQGGDPFTVNVSGPAVLKGFRDCGDGTYAGAYEVTASAHEVLLQTHAPIELSIVLNGKVLVGSPFRPVVRAPEVPGGEASGLPRQLQHQRAVGVGSPSHSHGAGGGGAASMQAAPAQQLSVAQQLQQQGFSTQPRGAPTPHQQQQQAPQTPRLAAPPTPQAAAAANADAAAQYEARLRSMHQGVHEQPQQQPAPATPAAQAAAQDAALHHMAARAADADQLRSQMAAASAGHAGGAAGSAGGGHRPQMPELFDPEVNQLFSEHELQLLAVFDHYSTPGARANAERSISFAQMIHLAHDYDVCPTFLSRKELKNVLGAVQRAHPADDDGFHFVAFIDCLGRLALTGLSKPAFASLYSSPAQRVEVMLSMWGLGDGTKLQKIKAGA